jgi:hypothetical protein
MRRRSEAKCFNGDILSILVGLAKWLACGVMASPTTTETAKLLAVAVDILGDNRLVW